MSENEGFPGMYDFATDSSMQYGAVDLSPERKYLRRYAFWGSFLLLCFDAFVLFLPWTIVASVMFELHAVFVWVIMLPFLVRIPLLLISLVQVQFPHKVGSALETTYKESRKYVNLRLLGVPGPFSSLRRYGFIAKLLHPILIIVALLIQGSLLFVWGSFLVFYLNLAVGAVIIIMGWVNVRLLMVECYSKPLTVALERQGRRRSARQ